MNKLKQCWIPTRAHNMLKSKAAKEGLTLTRYFDKLCSEDFIINEKKKKTFQFP